MLGIVISIVVLIWLVCTIIELMRGDDDFR